MRWFGHVERSSGEISRVRSMSIDGRRGLGRPRKTWSECVKDDLAAFKLKPCDAQDRAAQWSFNRTFGKNSCLPIWLKMKCVELQTMVHHTPKQIIQF